MPSERCGSTKILSPIDQKARIQCPSVDVGCICDGGVQDVGQYEPHQRIGHDPAVEKVYSPHGGRCEVESEVLRQRLHDAVLLLVQS